MEIDQGGELGKKTMVHVAYTPRTSPVDGQTMASPTSTTTMSLQQQALQTSTSNTTIEGQEKLVYDTFKEIKLRNEVLKSNTYNQL